MKIAVWDTYVPRAGRDASKAETMHFDILVPDDTPFDSVQAFGLAYLSEKGEAGQPLTTSECKFCHIEKASAVVETAISDVGYAIIEMEGCS